MSRISRFTISLPPEVVTLAEVAAAEAQLSVPAFIARLVTRELSAAEHLSGVLQRSEAEAELFDWLLQRLEEIRSEDKWDEYVTLRLFQQIERERLTNYLGATADGHGTRINRLIGKLVRQRLGAKVKEKAGKKIVVPVRHGEVGLITGFSPLVKA